jgi:tetratricopeptide (TPR) repeat protein
MKDLSSCEKEKYQLARAWANAGEFQAAFIVIEALWKKHPFNFQLFISFIELLEESSAIKAHSLMSDMLSGHDKWQDFLISLSPIEKSALLEKHALLALSLKDESSALESLKEAASLGRDTLILWSTLSYLYALVKDLSESHKTLCRALELYKEPSLFEENISFLEKNYRQKNVNEDLFLSICMSLLPQLPAKDGSKLLGTVKGCFPNRVWLSELQDIVAQENQKMPIGLSGEHYASSDKKNW